MKFTKIEVKKAIKEELEADNGGIIKVLEKLLGAIDNLDTSIDYLAAAATGADPLTIQLGQRAFGRLTTPPKYGISTPGRSSIKERAMMKIKKQELKEIIRQEIKEIMELPADLETPMGPEEQRMEALSRGWQKLINDEIWLNADVVDPVDYKRRGLDEFIAILGNYVVSDEMTLEDANDLVKKIARHLSTGAGIFEPNPQEWGMPLPKWEGKPFERLKEDDKSEEEEKTLKLPKYDPETRKRFQRQQSRKRSLARHKKARGLKSKAGI